MLRRRSGSTIDTNDDADASNFLFTCPNLDLFYYESGLSKEFGGLFMFLPSPLAGEEKINFVF